MATTPPSSPSHHGHHTTRHDDSAGELELRDHTLDYTTTATMNIKVTVRATPDNPGDTHSWIEEHLERLINNAGLTATTNDGEPTISITTDNMTIDDTQITSANGEPIRDDTDFCRTCGEINNNDAGDGWDGECGNCADRTHLNNADT